MSRSRRLVKPRVRRSALMVSLLLSSMGGARGWAGDDVVLIPARPGMTVPHAIPFDVLLANDGGPTSIESNTAAGRGTLGVSGASFSYDPNATFDREGMDSFRYEPAAILDPSYNVFLVRGLDQYGASEPMAEMSGGVCTLGTDWSFTSPVGGTVVLDGQGDCVIEFSMANSASNPRVVATPPEWLPGPGGGHTEMELDPGTGVNGISNHLSNLLMSGVHLAASGEEILFALRLDRTNRTLVGLALQDNGVYVETPAHAFPVSPTAVKVGLTWWYASRAGAGGLALEVDGVLVASRTGIQNGSYHGLAPTWEFGLRNFVDNGNPGPDDVIVIRNTKIFNSTGALSFPPVFSDHGHAPVDVAWSATVNGASISTATAPGSTDVERHLTVPLGGSVKLIDDAVAGLTSFGARFELGTETLWMPGFSYMTVFEATPEGPGSPPMPIRLQLLYRPDTGYKVRGRVAHGASGVATPWIQVDATASRHVIELRWRAATDASSNDGAFLLRVDDEEAVLDNLDNPSLSLEEIRLGPSAAPSGVTGTLIVDAFEGWQ